MVYTIRKLSEEEKIKQQCEARAKFESDWKTTTNAIRREATEQGLKDGLELGLQQGLQHGLQQGKAEERTTLIIKKVNKNKTLTQIAYELEEDPEVIRPIYDTVVANQGLSAEEIIGKLL